MARSFSTILYSVSTFHQEIKDSQPRGGGENWTHRGAFAPSANADEQNAKDNQNNIKTIYMPIITTALGSRDPFLCSWSSWSNVILDIDGSSVRFPMPVTRPSRGVFSFGNKYKLNYTQHTLLRVSGRSHPDSIKAYSQEAVVPIIDPARP